MLTLSPQTPSPNFEILLIYYVSFLDHVTILFILLTRDSRLFVVLQVVVDTGLPGLFCAGDECSTTGRQSGSRSHWQWTSVSRRWRSAFVVFSAAETQGDS